MKLVELFCGTGGFSRGAEAAGFEVAAAYDVDRILTSSYALNFPSTKLFHRDVSGLTGDQIRSDVDCDIDGVFGGPPCQGFSDIGRRDGNDPRRLLLGHFFRVVEELRPQFFIMENVRGLSYPGARPLLDAALDRIRDSYDVLDPVILDAADFGAATRRKRLFAIGISKGLCCPLRMSDIDKQRRPAATVREAIADLEKARPLPGDSEMPELDRWKITRRGPPSDYARTLRSPDGVFTGHRETEHTELVKMRFSKVAQGATDRVGRHPRLAWDSQCPTLRAGTGNDRGSYQSVRPIHPVENRVITVREGARLQGFPDSHIFHPTTWHSFRMIGNSVSPIMSYALFAAIRDRLNESSKREAKCGCLGKSADAGTLHSANSVRETAD